MWFTSSLTLSRRTTNEDLYYRNVMVQSLGFSIVAVRFLCNNFLIISGRWEDSLEWCRSHKCWTACRVCVFTPELMMHRVCRRHSLKVETFHKCLLIKVISQQRLSEVIFIFYYFIFFLPHLTGVTMAATTNSVYWYSPYVDRFHKPFNFGKGVYFSQTLYPLRKKIGQKWSLL